MTLPATGIDSLTLHDAFEQFHRGRLSGARATTVYEYQGALNRWAEFTANPPVGEITETTFEEFARAVVENGSTNATARKHCRSLRPILTTCKRMGFIDRVPAIPRIHVSDRIKPRPSIEQVGQLYAAIGRSNLTWPMPSPTLWWRTWLVLAFVTGMRLKDILQLRWSHIGNGFIEWEALKTRKTQFVPFDRFGVVHRHLRAMKKVSGKSPVVLPAGNSSHSLRQRYREIGETAGIDWTPHHIRRASIDAWRRAGGTDAAGLIHGTSIRRNVLWTNYMDWRDVLRDAVNRLQLPAEMLTPDQRNTNHNSENELLECFRRLDESDQTSILKYARKLAK